MVDQLIAVDTDAGPREPMPVTMMANGSEVDMDSRATTSAFTSVASQVAAIAILAANPARRGAVIVNTDANVLYLDLTSGTLASATRHAAQVPANGAFQVPFGYTGAISGAWALDGTGAALVTEFAG